MRQMQSPLTLVMTPVWLVFWAVMLSLTWLLPPHFPPWSTFPADFWIAVIAIIGGIALVIKAWHKAIIWHTLPCIAGILVLFPWLQFGTGLLPYAGQAWVSSVYLLGFLLALLVGACWEQSNPLQLAHGLFVAIGIAAVLSVGLQLFTWLGLAEDGSLGIWAVNRTNGRPSANFGQPNQLATLLIWGLLACLWAYLHKSLGHVSAIFLASFLLLGLAMTQSRSGMLALSFILLALWARKSFWPSRRTPVVATFLYLLFLAYPTLLGWLDSALLLNQESMHLRLINSGELRLRAWQLFTQAILERPLFGYGWSEVASAQLTVADKFSSLGVLFKSSHNLFIDLLLWCGLPIGMLIIAFLIRWFWLAVRSVGKAEDATLLMFVGAVIIHAMVEFPLQYAYFLIPLGFVTGSLNIRLGMKVVGTTPRWILAGLLLSACVAIGITFSDYAQVDSSYRKLRLEGSILGQGRGPMGEAPEVLTLTHLREWIRLARYSPHAGMSSQELDELETMAQTYPSPPLAYEMAKAMALNAQPERARVWLTKICKLTNELECGSAMRSWKLAATTSSPIAAVPWPEQ
jgi:Virulence factor membrane-bound polymerase, C-terminal/Protein glycosylation ligase/O-Antigen ligase